MDRQETLRETVARFLKTDPSSLTPDFPLRGPRMEGSVARYALDAAIRRAVGVRCRAVYTAKIYGALEAAVMGKEAPDGDEAASATDPGRSPFASALGNGGGNAVSCGVDMELVANLPEADDYWTHEFYQTHFTKAEIAYCLTKEQPLMHFAARWCAKEALKKCDAAFLREDMNRLEVTHDQHGGVALQYRREEDAVKLPHALSISHTPNAAVAAVVYVNGSALANATEEAPAASEPAVEALPRPAANGRLSGKLALLMAFAALVLAVIALIAAQ